MHSNYSVTTGMELAGGTVGRLRSGRLLSTATWSAAFSAIQLWTNHCYPVAPPLVHFTGVYIEAVNHVSAMRAIRLVGTATKELPEQRDAPFRRSRHRNRVGACLQAVRNG